MPVKVSLIVPVFNEEKNLPACMDSMLGQTLKEIEIILVDDGSVDGSPQLCDNYALKDPRVHVVHKKNEGAGAARNSGLKEAAGAYVGFVDSDDYIKPEMCEKLYQAALQFNADIVLAGMCHVGGNLFAANEEREICCFPGQEIFEGQEGRQRLMLGMAGALPWEREDSRYNFSVCKNLYRRSLIEEKNIQFISEREFISEDLLFLLGLVSHIERGVGIPGAFYCYCRREGSFTKQYCPELFGQFKKMVIAVEKELRSLLPEADIQPYVDRLFQSRARVALAVEIQHALDNGNGYKQTKQKLLEISRDEKLQEVLHRYPYWKLPKKQAVFAFAMRYQMAMLQYLLVCSKERWGK